MSDWWAKVNYPPRTFVIYRRDTIQILTSINKIKLTKTPR